MARVESGTECTDGKDNDGDKLIDCDDPDCKPLPVCGGRVDARPDVQRTDGPRPDRPADSPRPDQPAPTSSFGQTCSFKMPIQACSDGKTYCILGDNGSQTGYCAYLCDNADVDACPQGPSGTTAKCVWGFNSKWYCSFMCRWQGQDYPCPSTSFGCYTYRPSQMYCWPK